MPLPERDPELEYDCPGLVSAGYSIKSPVDSFYNCVAFALGDVKNYWDDVKVKGYYWPSGCSADTVDGWANVFRLHNYEDCDSDLLESDFEKIAIYANANSPGHVARQKASGVWVSKMGKGCDIEHSTLAGVECEIMGKVVKIMKRKCPDGKRVLE